MTPTANGLLAALAAAMVMGAAARAEEPMPGKQVHFPQGTWSAVPQFRNGKVRQCVLVALRPRAGGVDTRFSIVISRGTGLAFGVGDERLLREEIFDDRAEIVIDGKAFPAVALTIAASNLAFHPGDADGALHALAGAEKVTLRSAGAGLDSGPIAIVLPREALGWLTDCGKKFAIAIDRPTDPDARPLPTPRPPSPEIGTSTWTAAGPPGIEDKQKINTWDASELRDKDGKVIVCMIRRHYYTGSGPNAEHTASFFMVSRVKGFNAMLKYSALNLTPNEPIAATIAIDHKPFTGFTANAISKDEIGIYPQNPSAFAALLDDGVFLNFKSKVTGMELPVQGGVMAWLRACARRHAIPFDGPGK